MKPKSELIYDALNVSEVYVTPPGTRGVGTYQKAVGGLSCMRSHVVAPNAPERFVCRLAADDRDDAAIYSALNVGRGQRDPGTLVVGDLPEGRRWPRVHAPQRGRSAPGLHLQLQLEVISD